MRQLGTLDLPPQFVHSLEFGQKGLQQLICGHRVYGFKLHNRWPDNIAYMQDGTVVYCTEFKEPDTDLGPFSLIGFKFEQTKATYNDIGDSRKVGMVIVGSLIFIKKIFSSDDLCAKCTVFAMPGNTEDSQPVPTVRLQHAIKCERTNMGFEYPNLPSHTFTEHLGLFLNVV